MGTSKGKEDAKMYPKWVDEREQELLAKGRDNWDADDVEEWEYLQEVKEGTETCGIF